MKPRFVHIVWAPATGPIRAYWRADHMHSDALTMVGADVVTLAVLDALPEEVLDLIQSDYDGDDDTPPAMAAVDDID